MCVSLGKFDFLINPTAPIRQLAKAAGADAMTATILSGDLTGHKDAVAKEDKEQEKKDKANNEAWRRYYATRDAAAKQTSALSSSNVKSKPAGRL